MRASSYVIYSRIPDSNKTIVMHGYRGTVDIMPNEVAKLLMTSSKQAKEELLTELSPETVQMLRSRGYLTDLSPGEELELFKRIARAIHNTTRQTHFAPLIIPTYSCNLRCFYCYQDHLHNENNKLYQIGQTNVINERMIEAAFDAIEKLRPIEAREMPVTLGLYGGEPFLAENRPVIEYIVRRAHEQGYSMNAVTNASELHNYYDLLGPHGIGSMQVTFDGSRNSHDCRRICSDGTGTYDVIVANVTEALKRGAAITIRVNLDRDNIGDVKELTNKFVEYGWAQYKRFWAYAAPLHSYEVAEFKSNMTQGQLADELEKMRGELAYPLGSSQKELQGNLFSQFLRGNTKGRGPFRTGVCSAVYGMYIFDPYGDVYACWDEAGNKEHRVGVYGKGFLELNNDRLSAWIDRSISEVEQCSKCAYGLVCGGGCAYLAAEEKGTYYASYCDNFQRNFRQTMVTTYVKLEAGGSQCQVAPPEGQVCA